MVAVGSVTWAGQHWLLAPFRIHDDFNLETATTFGYIFPSGFSMLEPDYNNADDSAGKIAEILVSNSVLSDADRLSAQQYLDAKYLGGVPEPSVTLLIPAGFGGMVLRRRGRTVA